MDVGIKIPSGLMFLVICNPTIKNIFYLILSYLIFHNDVLILNIKACLQVTVVLYCIYSVIFEVKVYCNPSYYLESCDKLCKPHNDSQGHYYCDHNGNKVCHSGELTILIINRYKK